MKKPMHSKSRRSQHGFSLVELIIAGVLLIGMLAASGVFNFSGDNSRATNILSIAKELGSAATRYNADTAMNPKAPWSLFNRSKNTSADTFEGLSADATWRGPYVNAFGPGANGEYPLSAYIENATITFNRVTSGLPSGASSGYEVVITGMPEELTRTLMGACNGTTYDAAASLPSDHSAGLKCSGSINATSHVGTAQYLYMTK